MTIGIMEVNVVGARGLKNTDFLGRIDPYVIVEYKREEQKSRSVGGKAFKSPTQCCMFLKGKGNNPVWNEKFRFKVEYPIKGTDEHYKLVLKIMDRDAFTDDDFLGQATIYLKELFEIGVENGKAELHTQKYRVVSSNQTYRGEVQVGITFTVEEETDRVQEYGGWKESQF